MNISLKKSATPRIEIQVEGIGRRIHAALESSTRERYLSIKSDRTASLSAFFNGRPYAANRCIALLSAAIPLCSSDRAGPGSFNHSLIGTLDGVLSA